MSVQVSATFNGAEETFCAETIPLTPSTLAIPPFHMHTVRDNCHFSLCLPITSPSSLPPSLPNSLSPTYSLQRSVGFCGGRAILTRPRGSGFQRQESCRIMPHRIAKRVRQRQETACMLLRVVLLKTGTSQLPDTKQVQTVKPYAPKSGTCSSVSQVTTSQLSDTFSGANTLFLELGLRTVSCLWVRLLQDLTMKSNS